MQFKFPVQKILLRVDKKLVGNMTVAFGIMAAMIGLLCRWAIQNKSRGYRRPLRQPLLVEGLVIATALKEALTYKEPPKANVPTQPVAGPTPVDQLVALSSAVQAANPVAVGDGSANPLEKTEPPVSVDEQLVIHSTEKQN